MYKNNPGNRLASPAIGNTAIIAAMTILLIVLTTRPAAALFKKDTIMVPMRDGVRLATDVLTVDKDAKRPVILVRTPYGKDMVANLLATQVMGKKYVLVVQDTRGMFASEGTSRSFLDDSADGYDTVEWAASQPWSNGDVGTVGISALGLTQYAMASQPSPHLKSQFVMAAAGSLYHDVAFQGGGFQRSLVVKWLSVSGFPLETIELLLNTNTYGEMWSPVNLYAHLSKVKVPVFHMAGWYDIFLMGNINAYDALQRFGGPGAKGRQKLLIGPWTHVGWGALAGTKQGSLTYPANSGLDVIKKALGWFDETLKGQNRKIMSGANVKYYVMGDPEDPQAPGNEWRESSMWPPAAKSVNWYFSTGGVMSTVKPPAGAPPLDFSADPANPVQTIGGANLFSRSGPHDQREIEKRGDVLVFTTAAMREPLNITGPLKAELYVSTDSPDTDVNVRITDVYPDGRSMLIADGLVRLSRMKSPEKPGEKIIPGKVYKVTVDVTATSLIFNRGHRIRAIVSGSNFPRYDVNQNNGQFLSFEIGDLRKAADGKTVSEFVDKAVAASAARTAHTRLYVDSRYPSHFILPEAAL